MPQSNRRFLILFAGLLGAVFVVAVVVCVSCLRPGCHAMSRVVKLADLSGSDVAINLICPEGQFYQLVLGLDDYPYRSDVKNPPFAFAGTVHILQETTEITSFVISSKSAEWCNWLQDDGIFALILTGYLGEENDLDNQMTPGERYTLQVEFDVPPPGHTSLWLSWVQDYDENASDATLEVIHEFANTQPNR